MWKQWKFTARIDGPPSEPSLWFGISRMVQEIPNQNSRSRAMVPSSKRQSVIYHSKVSLSVSVSLKWWKSSSPTDGFPHEQTFCFGISCMKHEITNQKSFSQASGLASNEEPWTQLHLSSTACKLRYIQLDSLVFWWSVSVSNKSLLPSWWSS